MPGHVPTEDELRAADRIVLVDPNMPGWCRPLFVRFTVRAPRAVEIPVDSQNFMAIEEWMRRIDALGLRPQG